MRCVFLGPPGAGKGTQAFMLSKILDVPHLSTGDMLRSAIKNSTKLGKRVEKLLESGTLVPDSLILSIVRTCLQGNDCKSKGFLFDGFPRTIHQAIVLDEILLASLQKLDFVFLFTISDCTVMERVRKRVHDEMKKMLCNNASENSNSVRSDAGDSVVRHRLEVYRQETLPLVDFYRQRGGNVLKTVDASLSVEDVHAALLRCVI